MLPRLLEFQEPEWIKLERVAGQPYLDLDFSAKALGLALADFHLATWDGDKCLCHIDNQPRNILANGKKFWFLDFSDSRFDYPEFDLCHLLLFWAADLPETQFETKLRAFMSAYNAKLPLRPKPWKANLLRAIECFEARRARFSKQKGKNPPEIIIRQRHMLATASSPL